MADIRWNGKDKTHLHRFQKTGEAPVSTSDVLRIGPGETLAIFGPDGGLAGVLGPGDGAVSAVPFLGALGTPGVFGRLPVALFWASTAPVPASGEWPLPPIADPGSNRPCAGASVRATYSIAVTDVAKLLAALHTPAREIQPEAGHRAVKTTLAKAFSTFWNESREPVVLRQASMQEMVPKLAATVLDGQGLAISGFEIALRLPVGFTATPGSPLR
jgi:hypothetical protein